LKPHDFEERMRLGECFRSLRVPPGMYIVIRADGRTFSRLTERIAEKPFDEAFHAKMVRAATAVLESLQATYAHTQSDEISVLLPQDVGMFDREVEKLVSLCAARASATLSLLLGEAVEFDARVWAGADEQAVVDYFQWRQTDATRNALNGWAYWTLRREGKSVQAATKMLDGAAVSTKNELLFARGINFNSVPAWQRRGTGVYWETYEKDGRNPKTGRTIKATRRRITANGALPMKEAYARFIRERIA
jgi:tRNA(His) 5'-end guanylyltransferase